jgi:uncharacterized protein YcbX
MRVGTVVEVWRYPVKSLGGERLATAAVHPAGIEGDRRLAVVDEATGKVLSAKTVPRLLQASARWEDGTVHLGDGAGLAVSSADPDADRQLSSWLGRPVRLQAPVPGRRSVFDLEPDPDDPTAEVIELRTPPGSFYDSRSTLHLLTTASLGDHDRRRFRPNLVVDAGSGDHPEDGWIGGPLLLGDAVEATVRKATARCVLITRPQPGLPPDVPLFRDLVRRRAGNLGVYVDPQTSGSISAGDPVARG